MKDLSYLQEAFSLMNDELGTRFWFAPDGDSLVIIRDNEIIKRIVGRNKAKDKMLMWLEGFMDGLQQSANDKSLAK